MGVLAFIAALLLVASVGRDKEEAAIEALRGSGSNPKKLHEMEFFFEFYSEELARKAAKEIGEKGFATEVHQIPDSSDWACVARKIMVPELEALCALRVEMEEVAGRYGGEYGGWGASPA